MKPKELGRLKHDLDKEYLSDPIVAAFLDSPMAEQQEERKLLLKIIKELSRARADIVRRATFVTQPLTVPVASPNREAGSLELPRAQPETLPPSRK